MVEILSQSQQTNIEALLNAGCFEYDNYWIGLNDVASEGKFEWQHSFTPLGEYNNWDAGEPDDYEGKEDCVMIWGRFNWSWNDFGCDHNLDGTEEIHALCQY